MRIIALITETASVTRTVCASPSGFAWRSGARLSWRARSTGRRFTGPSPFARVALEHIGEPIKAPVLSPARGPPACVEALDQTPPFDPLAPAPEPAFELD